MARCGTGETIRTGLYNHIALDLPVGDQRIHECVIEALVRNQVPHIQNAHHSVRLACACRLTWQAAVKYGSRQMPHHSNMVASLKVRA